MLGVKFNNYSSMILHLKLDICFSTIFYFFKHFHLSSFVVNFLFLAPTFCSICIFRQKLNQLDKIALINVTIIICILLLRVS